MICLDINPDINYIDSNAIMLAILGYLIVFSALVLLYLVFNFLPKLIHLRIRRKLKEMGKSVRHQEVVGVSGEVNAAISLALYLYMNELHDEESHIMTIRKTSKTYSPWNSKIYAVRNYFNRR